MKPLSTWCCMWEADILSHSRGWPFWAVFHSVPFPCPSSRISKCCKPSRQNALPQLLEYVLFPLLTISLWFSPLFGKCLKCIFKEHTAENILLPTNRHLLYEEKLTLAGKLLLPLKTQHLCYLVTCPIIANGSVGGMVVASLWPRQCKLWIRAS